MQNSVVVVSGDLADDFNIVGPFENFQNAIEYAESNIKNEDWWTTNLKDPFQIQKENIDFDISF